MREISRNRPDRILTLDFAALPQLSPLIEPGMDVGHEGVKMRAPFARRRGGVEKHVHEHRLAATHGTMDVKAARRLGGLRAKQPRKTARLSLGLVALQFVGERVELADKVRLRRVRLEPALGDERAIAVGDRSHVDRDPRSIRAMAIVS